MITANPIRPRLSREQKTEAWFFPAPIGGFNARFSFAQTPEENCLLAQNIVPSEFGLRTRPGYGIHQEDVPGTGVLTVVPFEGQDHVNDSLFCVSNLGIYDVTIQGATPIEKVLFPVIDGNAGYATFTNFADQNGEHYILLADLENGLYLYTESTGAWTPGPPLTYPGGTPPLVTDVVNVAVHKRRVWLTIKGTQTGWYFGIDAFQGDVTPFYFGSMFPQGGELVGIWNWPLDGGAGVDDILVAISRGGDVTPYQGADPSSAESWQIIGTFNVGTLPAGRRQAAVFGGDLHVISTLGITALSDLTQGQSGSANPEKVGFNIAQILRKRMHETLHLLGWEISQHTVEGVGVISGPTLATGITTQLVLNFSVQGWGAWEFVDMFTTVEWDANPFFAKGNNVYFFSGDLDNVNINGEGGIAVEFNVLTGFSTLDKVSQFKKVQLIRTQWVSVVAPSFSVRARYDFDTSLITAQNPGTIAGPGEWDQGLWNNALWAGGPQGHELLNGAQGQGRWVAMAMTGKATRRAALVGWDVMFEAGGMI